MIADSNVTDVKHDVSDIKLSRLEGKWKTMDLKRTSSLRQISEQTTRKENPIFESNLSSGFNRFLALVET